MTAGLLTARGGQLISRIQLLLDIEVERLKKLLKEKKVELTLTDSAKGLLANEGYDTTYGARPLKRLIQRRLQDPLATKLLEGEFREGDSIVVGEDKGMLIFERAKAKRQH